LIETTKLLYSSKQSDDWINFLNIGNIMYLAPLNCEDLDLESDPRFELLRDAVVEKVIKKKLIKNFLSFNQFIYF